MSDKISPVWRNVAKGVRYREHTTRKHGKRPDRYYCLIYKKDGKTVQEALGWASDGVTQAEAERRLAFLRENWRTGTGPKTLAEMRAAAAAEKDAAEKEMVEEQERRITVQEYFDGHFCLKSI